MATSILRMEAACCASLVSNLMRSSLVTPSTIVATSLPKSRLEVLDGHAGVLHGVVQQGGGHRHVVEAEVGHDPGHGQRVLDVRLTRAAELPPMGFGRGEVRPVDQLSGPLGWRVR